MSSWDERVLFLSDIFPTGWMAAESCGAAPAKPLVAVVAFVPFLFTRRLFAALGFWPMAVVNIALTAG